jgi:hypothetical protein
MNIQDAINEALEVKKIINEANKNMPYNKTFGESEVQLRYETLKNILCLLGNEITEMIVSWQTERDETEKENI